MKKLLITTVLIAIAALAFTKIKNAMNMKSQNFEVTMLVDQSPAEVFKAINNVRGWWSENIDGATDVASAEFLYHYKDVHITKIKVETLVPNEKVVWKVLENHFNFTKNPNEWVGNELVFDISPKGDQTQVKLTQIGLTPAEECYDVCHDAWTGFVTNSLRKLISTGKGEPTPKDTEWGVNEELIEKWKLNEKAAQQNFTYNMQTSKSPAEVFNLLLDIDKWWSGQYTETITGESKQLGDEFSFKVASGVHNSTQKLVELVPNKRVVWLVTDSNLTSFDDTQEWTGTKISFNISQAGDKTQLTFTHEGLTPQLACYNGCSSAWTGYMKLLKERLN